MKIKSYQMRAKKILLLFILLLGVAGCASDNPPAPILQEVEHGLY